MSFILSVDFWMSEYQARKYIILQFFAVYIQRYGFYWFYMGLWLVFHLECDSNRSKERERLNDLTN